MRLHIILILSLLTFGLAGCGGSSSASTGGSSAQTASVPGLSTPARVSVVDAK